MQWQVQHGDILDIPADVLVCSANVYLNLSGGVGGALLMRYGPAMQEALHNYLADRNIRYVERGAVITMPPCGTPYEAVLHAVAVDATYDTSLAIVSEVVRASLRVAAQINARQVAMVALATGYGRQSIKFFASALAAVVHGDFAPVDRVVIGLRSRVDAEELLSFVPQLSAV